MQDEQLKAWRHSHTFGQDTKRPGEICTLVVIVLTASMMVLEITAGLMFGSMALLANGLHMGSHAVALAIVALLAGKYFGAAWMDPAMGIVGAVLVARWSWGLLHSTRSILLDALGPEHRRCAIAQHLEVPGHTQIADLHLWAVGLAIDIAVITLISREPRSPAYYKAQLPSTLGLDHVTIEVHAYSQ